MSLVVHKHTVNWIFTQHYEFLHEIYAVVFCFVVCPHIQALALQSAAKNGLSKLAAILDVKDVIKMAASSVSETKK